VTLPRAPSASAVAVAAIIRDAARAGKLSIADIEVFAAALREAAVDVLLPQRPRDADDVGWLAIDRSHRCGKRACKCMRTAYRHGPYVVRYWMQDGRRRKERLGPLGRARSPTLLAPKLQAQLDALNKLDTRFLHDD
jgi:hypothetical protein